MPAAEQLGKRGVAPNDQALCGSRVQGGRCQQEVVLDSVMVGVQLYRYSCRNCISNPGPSGYQGSWRTSPTCCSARRCLDPDRPAIFFGTTWAQPRPVGAPQAGAGAAPARRRRPGKTATGCAVPAQTIRLSRGALGPGGLGAAVVPVNAKPASARRWKWIIDNAQARLAFVTADVAPGRWPVWRARSTSDPPPATRCSSRSPASHSTTGRWPQTTRPGCFTTSGTTGRPRRDADAPQPRDHGLTYFIRRRPGGAAGPHRLRRADVAWRRHHAIPHLMAGARRGAGLGRIRSGVELSGTRLVAGPLSMFAAPTIVKRLNGHAEATTWPERRARSRPSSTARADTGQPTSGALRVMGPRFVQIYGQGETPMGTALPRAILERQGTLPRPRAMGLGRRGTDPVQVRIADEDGGRCPPAKSARVLVRGDTVMADYWRNRGDRRPSAMAGCSPATSICLDGDEGFLAQDRSKDLIISGGSTSPPARGGEVLLIMPGVAEVAVVGAPDP